LAKRIIEDLVVVVEVIVSFTLPKLAWRPVVKVDLGLGIRVVNFESEAAVVFIVIVVVAAVMVSVNLDAEHCKFAPRCVVIDCHRLQFIFFHIVCQGMLDHRLQKVMPEPILIP
jgi:hypothetical protein